MNSWDSSANLQLKASEKQIYPYKQILLIYLVIRYVLQQYINYRQLKKTLITNMPDYIKKHGVNIHEFILSQAYSMDKLTFQMLCLSIQTCLEFLLIMANVRPFIWQNVNRVFPFVNMQSEYERALGYSFIYMFISKSFMVPLEAYELQIIDKKHKMVTKTLTGYIYDLIVDGILFLLFGLAPILYGYLRIVQIAGEYYFFFLQIFIFLVTIFYAQIYPYVTIYFNKFEPIKSEELLKKIKFLTLKSGFSSKQIKIKVSGEYEMHGAQYRGLGNKHFISIYQSILARLSHDQLMGVLCHEIGHWHHKHSLKTLTIYLVQKHILQLQNISLFYIYSFFVNNQNIFISFGFKKKSVIIHIIRIYINQIFVGTALFYQLYTPIIAIFYLLNLVIKRYFQFQSDAFAVKMGYGKQLKSSLIKLQKDSALKIKPDVLYAWVNFTHPSLWQRINYIEQLIDKRQKTLQKWLHLN